MLFIGFFCYYRLFKKHFLCVIKYIIVFLFTFFTKQINKKNHIIAFIHLLNSRGILKKDKIA